MDTIQTLIRKHEESKLNAINLIVSENRMTDRAREALSSDIQSRYAAEFYAGTKYIREIIELVSDQTRNAFGVAYANVSPVSGSVAFLSVVLAFTRAKDTVGRIPPFFPGGGYPFKFEEFERVPLSLPFSDEDWQIDVDAARELLREKRPPLVILASSIVTYPVPVREIAEVVHEYGGVVAFDGSHTLGLLLGGQFQRPLEEGADLIFGSTHKTFPGPQGAVIVTNNEDIHRKIQNYANFTPLDGPRLMCNPHVARIAATGIVLEETNWKAYAAAVVENARTIANTMSEEGVPLRGEANSAYSEFTYCHQVIPRCSLDDGKRVRDLLAESHVFVDGFARMGTSEITRLGFGEVECKTIGRIVAGCLKGDASGLRDHQEAIAQMIATHRDIVL